MDKKLTQKERKLVENNIDVINKVIRKFVGNNNNDGTLEYDDLYQIGAIALCYAAVSYDETQNVSFETYAYTVIKNEVFDSLRKLKRERKYKAYDEGFVSTGNPVEKELMDKYYLQALSATKGKYKGVARIGIEALELKLRGYSAGDVARDRKLKPSYITACISRARKCLLKDACFQKMIV